MTLEVLSAVGAVVQVVKTLYEYYNVHKRNKALLDILEGFSTNLTVVRLAGVRGPARKGSQLIQLRAVDRTTPEARFDAHGEAEPSAW